MKKANRKKRADFMLEFRSSPALRAEVFENLLQHIREGFSMRCFPSLSEKEIAECLQKYPEEISAEDIDVALRESESFWEGLGKAQADGRCLGNSRTWYYFMCNKYGWTDKVDVKATHAGQVSVQVVNYSANEQA